MDENNDINKYYNDINGIISFIKSSLFEIKIPTRSKTEKYVIMMEYLKELFSSINCDFVISNNVIRHIIVYGDISPLWQNEIIIYFNNKNLYFPVYIEKIIESLKLKNINIVEQNKKYIKFSLKIIDTIYRFIIKERNITYNYFFEINKLEYDIGKNAIINISNNNTWKINDEKILKLRDLNFFLEMENIIDKNNDLINYLSNNSLIIFELIEMLLCFPNYFTITEIKNFFINFNQLLQKKNKFTKKIKNSYSNDDDLVLYKVLIKFLYNLEENELFNIFIKYMIDNHSIFVNLISNIDIDKELFKIFDVYNVRDFICLIVFQYLIYKKRKIYKKKVKNNKEVDDLLDIFMNNSSQTSDAGNRISDDLLDLNMLDKNKFSSLKYLKETAKKFSKFENLLKLVFIKEEDEHFIKNFYNINMLLYTDLKNITKHHNLKIAYIIRRFHFTNEKLLLKIVNIFNSIIKYKKYDDRFIINKNFINIITSQKLNNYIFKKMTMIPKINENLKNNIDCVDILDFQDTFILFIEFIYKNKLDYSENEPDLIEWFDAVFEASLCDMRSYRVFKNEKRKKKEKKIKKEKKLQKEIKKNKYKIVNKTSLDNNIVTESCTAESSTTESSTDESSTDESSIIEKSIIENSTTELSDNQPDITKNDEINNSNNTEYDNNDSDYEDDMTLENFLDI